MTNEKTIHERLVEIQQGLKVEKNQFNDFGGFKYRSSEDILEAVKPLLNECTVVLTDELLSIGERYYVKATATLSNGKDKVATSAYAREQASKPKMDESQVTGSASSYARKYALNGLFAIDDTKDADTMDNSAKEPKKAKDAGMGDVPDSERKLMNEAVEESVLLKCETCGKAAVEKQGISKKTGKPFHAIFCSTGEQSHAKFLAVS